MFLQKLLPRTNAPTVAPTANPTFAPTSAPTEQPTAIPSVGAAAASASSGSVVVKVGGTIEVDIARSSIWTEKTVANWYDFHSCFIYLLFSLNLLGRTSLT